MEAYRTHLYGALHSASRDYDQAILTLAAGTLALSVTFAQNITRDPVGDSRTLLLLAWAALALSSMSMVVSFLTSQHVLRNAISELDNPDAPFVALSGWAARSLNCSTGWPAVP